MKTSGFSLQNRNSKMAAPSEVIAKDIPEMVAILSDVNDKLSDANQRVLSLTDKVVSNTVSAEKGVSFLEVKFHLLLSYLINLVHYMLLKTQGKPIENSPTIDRMVELRTVMEKIRPIDQKLKYQVDKLIKIATTGIIGQENDPLRFKPRPDNLISKLEPNTEDGVDDEDNKPGIYVPPKVAAVHFDDKKLSKQKKSDETARKKALSSSLLKELRDEYSEAPEELKEDELFDWRKEQEKDEDKHQERYEEENMVRLMRKKHGKPTKQQARTLDDLTMFTDLSILTKNTISSDESEDNQDSNANTSFSKKKRKSRSSGKSGSGKKQKRSFKRQ